MNKIELQIQKIKKENRLGLMTHVVFGYPTIEDSKNLAKIMAKEGVDFIELQIPFSDPVADGPTLMQANQIAIKQKTKVHQAIKFISELSKNVNIPILFMTYFNIVFQYGVERFCKDAKKAGCSGLIVPDIPLDEEPQEGFISSAEKNNLIAIRVLSPASNERRISLNAPLSKGFIYYTSHKGITGTKTYLDPELEKNIKKIKKKINTPIAVGFGISSPAHINALKGKADIVVIGSAVLNVYTKAMKGQKINAVKIFIKSLVNATQ